MGQTGFSMLEVQPLKTDFFDSIDLNQGKVERLMNYIPFLGWMISAGLWKRRNRPLYDEINRALEARPFLNTSIWGDERHQEIAQFVCSAIKDQIGWPNDRFIPADPFRVVMWSFYDGLEMVEIIMDIEDKYLIKLGDQVLEPMWKQDLAAFVNLVVELAAKPAAAQESSPANPLPS